jgi:hypothetical protein
MQELQQRDLSDWSRDEIDGFIVDAYLLLEASMEGRLRTTDGLVIEPHMNKWGMVHDEVTCQACLAGAFFVEKVGTPITNSLRLHTFDNEEEDVDPDDIIVLTFLDGLRYLEEGGSIHLLLCTMGYGLPPVSASKDDGGSEDEKVVASRLERFITLNPRLTRRLQEHTRKPGGEK